MDLQPYIDLENSVNFFASKSYLLKMYRFVPNPSDRPPRPIRIPENAQSPTYSFLWNFLRVINHEILPLKYLVYTVPRPSHTEEIRNEDPYIRDLESNRKWRSIKSFLVDYHIN